MTDLQGGPPTFLDDSGGALVSSSGVAPRRPWSRRLGLVAATAVIAGAGAFAVTSALSQPAGPRSPEDAVTQFFAALDAEDVLGMTELMLPSERESLVDPGLAVFAELQRLGIVDEAADLGNLPYLDITIEGLEVESTPITEGLVVVEPIAGTLTAVGSGAVPWGERFGVELDPWEEEPVSLADESVAIAVVEDDGSWYVSLYYSIAEAARAEAGGSPPVLGAGPAPVGAEDPHAVMAALLQHTVALDPRGVLTLIDPEEARVLYDYSYLFLGELEAGADGLRAGLAAEGVTLDLDGLETSWTDHPGRTVVGVDAFTFRATSPDGTTTVSLAEGCLTFVDPYGWFEETVCLDELDEQLGMMGLGLTGEAFQSGLTVVERDGRWYVSLSPTVLHGARDHLAGLEPADLDDFFGNIEGQYTDPFGVLGALDGIGSDIGG